MSNETLEQEQTKSEGSQEGKTLEEKFYSTEKEEKKIPEESNAKESKEEQTKEGATTEQDKSSEGSKSSEVEKKESTEGTEDKKEYGESDLTLPKESMLNEDDLEGIVNFAKEQGLSKEQAQKLVDRENALRSDFQKAQQDFLVEQSGKWMEEMEQDKVFGGENLRANAEHARRALEKFGDERLIEDIKKAQLGNHPGLSRLLMRIGKAMADDTFIKGDKAPQKKKTYEEIFYGNNQ